MIKILERNFLTFLISLLVLLVIIYCLLHSFNRTGYINNKPSVDDLGVLNNLDTNNAIFTNQAIIYLDKKYEVKKLQGYEADLRSIINDVGRNRFISIITETGIKKKSYFWLSDDNSLIELIFWALFGTICSFLYYYVEYQKKGALDEKEFPSYIAKLFYTPFIVIILYFSPNLFTSDKNFSIFFGYWTIVLSFILGFFSGRAIELLDRLKNFIFPYNPPTQDAKEPESSTDKEVPEEIIKEAMDEKTEEWTTLYGPFQSISIGRKRINDEKTEIFCIQFDVEKKFEPKEKDRKIPPFIEYKGKDGETYQIPTDVNQVGKTINNLCYVPRTVLTTGADLTTKLLGLSCSRFGSDETGSIGLKVKSTDRNDTKEYLLSCYHVFCPNEVMNGIFNLANIRNGQSFEILSPSHQDGGTSGLGTIRNGCLGENLDVAIAEIGDSSFLDNRIFGTNIRPSSKIIVGKSHVRKDYPVSLVGRTSGRQNGFLESHHTKVFINSPTAHDQDNMIEFNGILKTCKISDPGDSGTAVFDKEGNILGLLFASNDIFSYVLPIQKIFSKLKITFA